MGLGKFPADNLKMQRFDKFADYISRGAGDFHRSFQQFLDYAVHKLVDCSVFGVDTGKPRGSQDRFFGSGSC